MCVCVCVCVCVYVCVCVCVCVVCVDGCGQVPVLWYVCMHSRFHFCHFCSLLQYDKVYKVTADAKFGEERKCIRTCGLTGRLVSESLSMFRIFCGSCYPNIFQSSKLKLPPSLQLECFS